MENQRPRYSKEELQEFEKLLLEKRSKAFNELESLKASIRHDTTGADNNHGSLKTLEDGADALEREQLNQLAARTMKYIKQLDNALIRIKNNTYGYCVDTGKLISKERLKSVPHTQHSIEAKLNKR